MIGDITNTFTFQQTKTVDEELELQYIHRCAEVIIPNDLCDFFHVCGIHSHRLSQTLN